jgi:flavin-dependent dehydrogenase
MDSSPTDRASSPAHRTDTLAAMNASSEQYDIAIVGAGPAGSTAAALLADKGWRVIAFDKDRHPRFHIGESLLPLNLPLFERLGVMDAVKQVGLVKRAAEFHSMEHNASQKFFFRDGWDGPGYAFQVRRADFDLALANNARAKGAQVIEGCKVEQVELGRDAVRLTARADDGAAIDVSARYLIDATGRDTLLAGKLGLKQKNPKHTSAALYGHFRGAQRWAGEDEGNISVYWFQHGWMWFIPLADGSTSVGAVCWPYYLKTRQTDPSSFFIETLKLAPMLWERLKDAELISPATATGNYSYACSKMYGDRWVMVGDAFAFVDPVFSSGVYLAMNSASFAVEAVDAALREPARAPQLFAAFDKRVRRGLATFSWMIYRMTSPVMRDLLMAPRDDFGIKRAVISFLAGDVYQPGPVRRRIYAFRAIYYLSALLDWRRAWTATRNRKRAIQPQAIYATDGSG